MLTSAPAAIKARAVPRSPSQRAASRGVSGGETSVAIGPCPAKENRPSFCLANSPPTPRPNQQQCSAILNVIPGVWRCLDGVWLNLLCLGLPGDAIRLPQFDCTLDQLGSIDSR